MCENARTCPFMAKAVFAAQLSFHMVDYPFRARLNKDWRRLAWRGALGLGDKRLPIGQGRQSQPPPCEGNLGDDPDHAKLNQGKPQGNSEQFRWCSRRRIAQAAQTQRIC